ncbi:MAG: hypothetical protein WAU45_06755 [Blastocatellia bacterium]
MNEVFVMRRANGTLFTEEISGKPLVPIWSSEEAVLHYRERNPELGVFLPQRFSRSLLKSLTSSSGSPEFFLLSNEDADADLQDGRPVSLDEIFPEGENAPRSAHP